MVLRDDRLQVILVNMGVDFCGGNAFMAEHILHSPQIRSALYQVRGKAVTKGVGTDFFLSRNCGSEFLYDQKNHNSGEVCTPSIDKDIVLMARFNGLMYTNLFNIYFQIFAGLSADGYQSLFAALAFDFDEFNFQKQVGQFELCQFRNTQSTTVQNFQHGLVACALGTALVNCSD